MSTLNVSNITDGTTTVGTSYVVNGSAKAWVNFNGTGSIAIRDSENVSSLTDNGTGNYTENFINSMANANYSGLITGAYVDSGMTAVSTTFTCRDLSTASMRSTGAGTSNNALDMIRMCVAVYGDLA